MAVRGVYEKSHLKMPQNAKLTVVKTLLKCSGMAGIEDDRGKELVKQLVALQMQADALNRRGPSILNVQKGLTAAPPGVQNQINLSGAIRGIFNGRLNASSSVES